MNAQDSQGYTALMRAARVNFIQVVKILLDRPGIDLDIGCDTNETALIISSELGRVEVVRMLLEKGAKVDLQCTRGTTALQMAVKNGHESCVKLLLNAGANPNMKNQRNKSPVGIACERGLPSVIEHLVQSGGDLHDLQGNEGETALQLAMRRQSIEIFYVTENAEEEKTMEEERKNSVDGELRVAPKVQKLLSYRNQAPMALTSSTESMGEVGNTSDSELKGRDSISYRFRSPESSIRTLAK